MKEPTESIATLAGVFIKSELQEYCNSQFIALKSANLKVSTLQSEVEHLKELLQSTTTLIEQSEKELKVPSEQVICEIQIELIKKKGLEKELSIDDTKRLEILVKTLKIIREVPRSKKPFMPGILSNEDLMNLARPEES